MGRLSEDIPAEAPKAKGAPPLLPKILEALDDDDAAKVREWLQAKCSPVEIRRRLREGYPELDVGSDSSWFLWARQVRNEGKVF